MLIKIIIANGLIKTLTLANHKAFIEKTSLKDQEEHLTFIKLEKK